MADERDLTTAEDDPASIGRRVAAESGARYAAEAGRFRAMKKALRSAGMPRAHRKPALRLVR
jgi:hypothetical protein